MMKFAEDDQNVLSQDHNVQLSKVLSENYAYIGDSPIIEIWAAEHCEITMLPVKLTGLDSYTFMMPKDSVITGAVDDVYVITSLSLSLPVCLSVCLSVSPLPRSPLLLFVV